MTAVGFGVNGVEVEVDVEARVTLLDALRDQLGLTGTHGGCEQGVCGACCVLLDGDLVRSCLVLAVTVGGRAVTTIEGIAEPDRLHPVQEALVRHHGLQCGYCTPGIVLTLVDLLAHDPTPGEDAVRAAIAGNLCRCTGYAGIVDAIVELAGTTPAGTTPAGTAAASDEPGPSDEVRS